jgi:hypothetical protein
METNGTAHKLAAFAFALLLTIDCLQLQRVGCEEHEAVPSLQSADPGPCSPACKLAYRVCGAV